MSLPDLIEIVPLDKPVRAEITVPGSKSITNRALILAALADGEVTLTGALWSEDTQIMTECLQKLGFEIRVEDDQEEFCNRTITVKGLGGKIPNGGTTEYPLELFVGNAGTAARFLTAFVCLGNGVYRLSGVPRMHERPQAALFQALRELGYRVESENRNDKLPVVISHRATESTEKKSGSVSFVSLWQRKCKVSIGESSQFASALLLCAKVGGWKIQVVGENAEESPYVAMTNLLIEKVQIQLQKRNQFLRIEPDASSGSYFWAKGWLFPMLLKDVYENKFIGMSMYRREADALFGPKLIPEEFADERPVEQQMTFSVNVSSRWPDSGWQIDEAFPKFLWPPPTFPKILSRAKDLGDSIMTAITIALFADHAVKFTDLGRLRLQETERVVALRTELTKCGAKVVEEGDMLTVFPSPLHGAEIETYNDHRMAMCFAILGLKVPGIKIKNPACVKKTFPNFFQKLAAPPPRGLGAILLDVKSGSKLAVEELFAN